VHAIGGFWALLSIWSLTTIPSAFSVYILRTMFTERSPGTDAAAAVESLPGTLAIWFLLTLVFTAWGTAHTWQRPPAGRGPSGRRTIGRRLR
jgi:hypothetical protein